MLLHILQSRKCSRLSCRVIRNYFTGEVKSASRTPHLGMRVPRLEPFAEQPAERSPDSTPEVAVPDGYSKIYEFKGQGTIRFYYTVAGLCYVFITARVLYNLLKEKPSLEAGTEVVSTNPTPPTVSPVPVEEDPKPRDSSSPTPSEKKETKWIGHEFLTFLWDRLKNKDPIQEPFALAVPLALFVGLNLLIKRIVITTYRRGDSYISTFYSRFGTELNVVEHSKHDCMYWPKNALFKHTLHGRAVLIDPQFYVSKSEEMDMCTEVKHEEK